MSIITIYGKAILMILVKRHTTYATMPAPIFVPLSWAGISLNPLAHISFIMPILLLETKIEAGKEIVFDLSRSIDLHKQSLENTREQAIAGKTSGLISLNETVTWRAVHLGFKQNLTSKITEFDRPNYFVDEMVKGVFDHFRHEHHFDYKDGITLMKDIFNYKSPLGLLGIIADTLFLKAYLTKLLERRNTVIKEFAESEKWRKVLTS